MGEDGVASEAAGGGEGATSRALWKDGKRQAAECSEDVTDPNQDVLCDVR